MMTWAARKRVAERLCGLGRPGSWYQIGTNGTVTNGAVNFAQICVIFAKTISQICANSRNFRANFAQIRPILRKFCKFCMFPHLFDLHPRLLHHRLFRSKRLRKCCEFCVFFDPAEMRRTSTENHTYRKIQGKTYFPD